MDPFTLRFFLDMGFTYIPVSQDITPLISRILRGFMAFVHDIPEEEHAQWAFEYDGKMDSGCIIRSNEMKKDGTHRDNKLFFHYRSGILERQIQDKGIPLSPVLSDWFEACGCLIHLCEELMTQFGNALAPMLENPEMAADFVNAINSIAKNPDNVLRMLMYRGTNPENTASSAKPHTDRGFLTFAIHNTIPGLMVAPYTSELTTNEQAIEKFPDAYIPVDPQPNNLILFAGKKMEKLTQGKIPALYHGVQYLPSHQENRVSIVFFSHPIK